MPSRRAATSVWHSRRISKLLRPFGMGNPQPTLLVPSARFERVTGMGEDKEHSRFTLVAAGGREDPAAWHSGHRRSALAPALEQAARHRPASGAATAGTEWSEPRVILRALCPTEPGELRGARRGRALLG